MAVMGTMQAEGSWFALVADDDDDTRHLISRALRRAQLQVCEACLIPGERPES